MTRFELTAFILLAARALGSFESTQGGDEPDLSDILVDNGPPPQVPHPHEETEEKTGKFGGCYMIVETPYINKFLIPIEEHKWKYGIWSHRVFNGTHTINEYFHSHGFVDRVPYMVTINSLEAPVNREPNTWNLHKYQNYGEVDKKDWDPEAVCVKPGTIFRSRIGLPQGKVHIVDPIVGMCRPKSEPYGHPNEGSFERQYTVTGNSALTAPDTTDLTTCVIALMKMNKNITGAQFDMSTKTCKGYLGRATFGPKVKDHFSCLFPGAPEAPEAPTKQEKKCCRRKKCHKKPTPPPTEEKPTPKPTPPPTEKPTPKPTPPPTEKPTPKPTPPPTEEKPTPPPTEEKPTQPPTEEKPTQPPVPEKPTQPPMPTTTEASTTSPDGQPPPMRPPTYPPTKTTTEATDSGPGGQPPPMRPPDYLPKTEKPTSTSAPDLGPGGQPPPMRPPDYLPKTEAPTEVPDSGPGGQPPPMRPPEY